MANEIEEIKLTAPKLEYKRPAYGAGTLALNPNGATGDGGNTAIKNEKPLPSISYDGVKNEENKEQPENNGTNKLRVPLRDTAPTTVPGAGVEVKPDLVQGVDTDTLRFRKWLDDTDRRIESDEDREKREKREKRERLFAAIGDGLSSIANLYYTTKGALNTYDPKTSLSAKAQEYYDKYNKEFDDKQAKLRDERIRIMREMRIAERDRKKAIADAVLLKQKAALMERQGRAYEAQRLRYEAERKVKEADAAKKKAEEEAIKQKKENDKKVADALAGKYGKQGEAATTTAAANKTKAETDKYYKGALGSAAKQKAGAYVRDVNDKIVKRGNSNAPTTTVTYDKDGNVSGTRVTTRGQAKAPTGKKKTGVSWKSKS